MEVEGDGSGDLPMFSTTLERGDDEGDLGAGGAGGAGGVGGASVHQDGQGSVNESCQGDKREMDPPSSPSGGLPLLGANAGGDVELRGGLEQAVGTGGRVAEDGGPGDVHAHTGGESEGGGGPEGAEGVEERWGGAGSSRGGGTGGSGMSSEEAREMLRVARVRRANAEIEVRGMDVDASGGRESAKARMCVLGVCSDAWLRGAGVHTRVFDCVHTRVFDCVHACVFDCVHKRVFDCVHTRVFDCVHMRMVWPTGLANTRQILLRM